MMAVLGLCSLYTNKVNTVGPLYLVYNQMLVSSPLMLLWFLLGSLRVMESGGITRGRLWLEEGMVLFPWVVLRLG